MAWSGSRCDGCDLPVEHSMDNPFDTQGRPICPVCFSPPPLGLSKLREDHLAVHLDCFDGVLPWRPPAPESSSSAA